jgi:hypothetical protein
MPVTVVMVESGEVRESVWATLVTLRATFLAAIRWHKALTQGTDLAFPSVMSRPIVVFRPARVGGRGRPKGAESDRHNQGGLSIFEHRLISKLLCVINRGGPRFIPRPHSKYSLAIAERPVTNNVERDDDSKISHPAQAADKLFAFLRTRRHLALLNHNLAQRSLLRRRPRKP